MKHTKETLRKAVIKVFEDECHLDNYEMAALTEWFEEFRQDTLDARSEEYHMAVRNGLIGAIGFLANAQHITETQRDTLLGLLADVDNTSAGDE